MGELGRPWHSLPCRPVLCIRNLAMPCLAYCMQAWSMHSTPSTFVLRVLKRLPLQVGALQEGAGRDRDRAAASHAHAQAGRPGWLLQVSLVPDDIFLIVMHQHVAGRLLHVLTDS